ncbi:MAG: nucleotidyltransferase substrate binding protein [Desulfobacterales bacterium]|nr:nucleotidyltransferase substrate binding protein [Desulfobacterales bacterium]
MEHAGGYEKKLISLEQALDSFEKAMTIDTSNLGDIEKDTIKSGQVQKFEVCVELFWKMIKKFLYDIHGLESVSPKMAMKQLYRIQYVNEINYETLIEMINDRNRLSHVYNEEQFNEIYSRITEYLELMRMIVNEVTSRPTNP